MSFRAQNIDTGSGEVGSWLDTPERTFFSYYGTVFDTENGGLRPGKKRSDHVEHSYAADDKAGDVSGEPATDQNRWAEDGAEYEFKHVEPSYGQ